MGTLLNSEHCGLEGTSASGPRGSDYRVKMIVVEVPWVTLLLGVSANDSHCAGLAPGARLEPSKAAFSSIVAKVPG